MAGRTIGTYVHLVEVAGNPLSARHSIEKILAHILNKSTTSSVLVKLSISGWTWRSMKSLRRGRIVIGPAKQIRMTLWGKAVRPTRLEVDVTGHAQLGLLVVTG